jgi:hypothetical protein
MFWLIDAMKKKQRRKARDDDRGGMMLLLNGTASLWWYFATIDWGGMDKPCMLSLQLPAPLSCMQLRKPRKRWLGVVGNFSLMDLLPSKVLEVPHLTSHCCLFGLSGCLLATGVSYFGTFAIRTTLDKCWFWFLGLHFLLSAGDWYGMAAVYGVV